MLTDTSVSYYISQGNRHIYIFIIHWYTKHTTEQKLSSMTHHTHASLQEYIIGSLPYSRQSEKFFSLTYIVKNNYPDYTNVYLGFQYNSFFTFEVFFLSANLKMIRKTVLKYDLSSLILLICILQMVYSWHHITWNISSKSFIKKK